MLLHVILSVTEKLQQCQLLNQVHVQIQNKIHVQNYLTVRRVINNKHKEKIITGFLPISKDQIQGLFKDFQGPYEGYIKRIKSNRHFYKHI